MTGRRSIYWPKKYPARYINHNKILNICIISSHNLGTKKDCQMHRLQQLLMIDTCFNILIQNICDDFSLNKTCILPNFQNNFCEELLLLVKLWAVYPTALSNRIHSHISIYIFHFFASHYQTQNHYFRSFGKNTFTISIYFKEIPRIPSFFL